MTMTTIAMTADTFSSQIQKPGIVFIDFWASWCGPCRAFAPIFDAAAKRHPDITWAKVDTEAEQQLAGALAIRSIPTLMVFRDGVLVFAQPGLLPAVALDELVTKVRALNMADVRRKVSEAQGASSARTDRPLKRSTL
jgi:thioredoxin 1